MVCFLNIGRLLTHIDELRIFVSENKPHIIGINETKLDHTVINSEVEIDEYQLIRNDRNSFGGGVHCISMIACHLRYMMQYAATWNR